MRPFHYRRVDDANALRSLQRSGVDVAHAAFLAGGTTLLDLMKLDVMRPQEIVDVNGFEQVFGAIETRPNELRLGAMVRMAEAADDARVKRDYPVIAQSLSLAASPQIRNMASLGGNVLQRTRCEYFRDASWAHCNKRTPGSGCEALQGVNRKHAVLGVSDRCIATYGGDFAQALIALRATVHLSGPRRTRNIAFEQLHLGSERPDIETTLEPGEMITGFSIPSGPWTRRSLYLKIRDRESYEYALASAAVALDMRGDLVNEARIAVGSVAYRPWRAAEAEDALKGKRLDEDSAQAAAKIAFANAITHGQNDYKPELGRRTLVRALLAAKALEI
jgi:xanthine dehydrogenase YagS FAD-binding subunit